MGGAGGVKSEYTGGYGTLEGFDGPGPSGGGEAQNETSAGSAAYDVNVLRASAYGGYSGNVAALSALLQGGGGYSGGSPNGGNLVNPSADGGFNDNDRSVGQGDSNGGGNGARGDGGNGNNLDHRAFV